LRSYLAWHRGDIPAAERICRDVLAHSRLVQIRWGFFSVLFAGFMAIMQGRVDEGLARVDEAERAEAPT